MALLNLLVSAVLFTSSSPGSHSPETGTAMMEAAGLVLEVSLAAPAQNAAQGFKEASKQDMTAITTADNAVLNLSGGSFDLQPTVIAGGGGTSSSGPFVLDGTIGQAALGTLTDSTFAIDGGFWNQVSGNSPAPKKRRGQITSQ